MPRAPRRIVLDEETRQILLRCYKGESETVVARRAFKMLAMADGYLRPDGSIKPVGTAPEGFRDK